MRRPPEQAPACVMPVLSKCSTTLLNVDREEAVGTKAWSFDRGGMLKSRKHKCNPQMKNLPPVAHSDASPPRASRGFGRDALQSRGAAGAIPAWGIIQPRCFVRYAQGRQAAWQGDTARYLATFAIPCHFMESERSHAIVIKANHKRTFDRNWHCVHRT